MNNQPERDRAWYEENDPQSLVIVGTVEIVDCVSGSNSPWFFGKYGFVLANPVSLPSPVPYKGQLGFFEVPDDFLPRL